MPQSREAVRRQLDDLAEAHSSDFVEVALRDTLANVMDRDALNTELILAAGDQLNFVDIQHRLLELEKIGKPLPPAPPRGGASSVMGGRIGIQGNPIQLDNGYQGGWHFTQDNGWDFWLTITPRPFGGYLITNPAMRLTGQHGAAHITSGTTADFDENMKLVFDLNWGGHIGRYVCSIAQGGYSRTIEGKTFDVTNAGATYDFNGTLMSEDADRPGAGPSPRMPMIAVEALPNTNENGYNVVVSGSGFAPGDVVVVEGRATCGASVWDWLVYVSATVDAFGRFTSGIFGISKPAGCKYSFRVLSDISGYTAEVGI